MENETENNNKKKELITALHLLLFSKIDQNDMEIADIERKCMILKYLAASFFDSEEMTTMMLKQNLKEYQKLVDCTTSINNYWVQFKGQSLVSNNRNMSKEWKSTLNNTKIAYEYLNPLNCQSNNILSCKTRFLNDRHIDTIIRIWKNKDIVPRNRKISSVRNEKNNSHVDLSIKSQELISNNSEKNEKFEKLNNAVLLNCKETENVCSSVKQTLYEKSHEYIAMHNLKCDEIDHLEQNNSFKKSHSTLATMSVIKKEKSNNSSNNNGCGTDMENSTYKKINSYPRNESYQSRMNSYSKSTNYTKNRYERSNRNINTAENSANCGNEESGNSLTNKKLNVFQTAHYILQEDQNKPNKTQNKKTLGGNRGVNSKFVCPVKSSNEKLSKENGENEYEIGTTGNDERLKNIEPKMIELIKNEIMDINTSISWNDIAGLQYVKKVIQEIIVFPMLRPDIFTGLRRAPKGVLLFGPPGTGKTLIGKCIASQSRSTFFSISASSLTSKWIGEGEKMVRALFAVARVEQPSVIFIDEIDSLLSQRSETEHESSRRIKTEFLVQLDGATTSEEDRILIVGATNRPQELDEAARRRMVKRLYVPLPDLEARKEIIRSLLTSISHDLTENEMLEIAEKADGYSGADMANLCKEASMEPIRSIPFSQLENIQSDEVRQVIADDFHTALQNVRPSVSQLDLSAYVKWNQIYGSGVGSS